MTAGSVAYAFGGHPDEVVPRAVDAVSQETLTALQAAATVAYSVLVAP